MKILHDLVTVSREQTAMMSLGNREGGLMRGYVSQETCRMLVQENVQKRRRAEGRFFGSRVIGRTAF